MAGAALLAGCAALGLQRDAGPEAEFARPAAVEARQTALQTLPSGEAEAWFDVMTGTSGTVTVLRTYRGQDGRWCRLVEEAVERDDGASTSTRAFYCRASSGDWLLTAAG